MEDEVRILLHDLPFIFSGALLWVNRYILLRQIESMEREPSPLRLSYPAELEADLQAVRRGDTQAYYLCNDMGEGLRNTLPADKLLPGRLHYYYTTVHSTRARKVILALFGNAYMKVWLNGQCLVSTNEPGSPSVHVVTRLQAGLNELLVEQFVESSSELCFHILDYHRAMSDRPEALSGNQVMTRYSAFRLTADPFYTEGDNFRFVFFVRMPTAMRMPFDGGWFYLPEANRTNLWQGAIRPVSCKL